MTVSVPLNDIREQILTIQGQLTDKVNPEWNDVQAAAVGISQLNEKIHLLQSPQLLFANSMSMIDILFVRLKKKDAVFH